MKDYDALYSKLKTYAEKSGYKVRDSGTILDYKGMNPEAARELHFTKPIGKHEIDIEGGLSKKDKFLTLSHELIERRKMSEGEHYHQAHAYAERNQGNLRITMQDSFPKQNLALSSLGKYRVVYTHDDGDLTVKVRGQLYVVTTEGQIFKKIERKPIRKAVMLRR